LRPRLLSLGAGTIKIIIIGCFDGALHQSTKGEKSYERILYCSVSDFDKHLDDDKYRQRMRWLHEAQTLARGQKKKPISRWPAI
jgi:hypothetical protein